MLSACVFCQAEHQEHERHDATVKLIPLGLVLVLVPVCAFSLGWQLGVAIVGGYAALVFGAWRVSRRSWLLRPLPERRECDHAGPAPLVRRIPPP